MICLEPLDDTAVDLQCGTNDTPHAFHKNCILAWIDEDKTTCPLCKSENKFVKDAKEALKKSKEQRAQNEGGEDDESTPFLARENNSI